ncbi:MAG: LecA/PA-IL family lectin [Pyrinomonadaceae bacterium]
MSFKSRLFRICFSFVLVSAFSASVLADTIRLKDGSMIKGRIAKFADGKFVVEIGEGSRRRELTFSASEIESISFDPPSQQPVISQPVSYPKPEPKITQPPKVITTDSIPRTNETQIKQQPQVRSQPQPKPQPSTVNSKPIEWNKKVLADNTNNGWTNSGWVVKKGQRLHITADGKVSLGKGQSSSPSGVSEINDEQKLMKSVPTGALIAVIGDDNNDFLYIGAEREFTATRDGALFLGINEGNLNDNSGAYDVKIEINPNTK